MARVVTSITGVYDEWTSQLEAGAVREDIVVFKEACSGVLELKVCFVLNVFILNAGQCANRVLWTNTWRLLTIYPFGCSRETSKMRLSTR